MDKSFTCSVCKKTKSPEKNSCGTGYGITNNKKICYACCADSDVKEMKESKPGDKFTLYLTKVTSEDKKSIQYTVSNWPGTFKMKCYANEGRHNIAGSRIDAWFSTKEIGRWCGVQYGDNTEILHCKKLKG